MARAPQPASRPAAPRPTPPPRQPARPATPAAPPKVYAAKQVQFKEPTSTAGATSVNVEIPAEWEGDDVAVAGEFHATPDWKEPGEYCEGVYNGLSENRGPNHQRMYHFRHPQGGYFDVWGTSVIDTRIDEMTNSGRLFTGYLMRITYKGDQPTARGQSPAHIFDIRARAVEAQ